MMQLGSWTRSVNWKRAWPLFSSTTLLVVLAILVAPFDGFASSVARNMSPTGDWRRLVMLSEVFAYGGTVAIILLCLWWIDVAKRPQIVIAATLTTIAGLSGNLLKALLPRVRPNAMSRFPLGQSENGWVRFDIGSYWDSVVRSFPSGHAATAVGLALALGLVYPRGRYFFLGFAAVASLQRLISGAHYPSDILVGAALGTLTIGLWKCLHPTPNAPL